MDLPGLLLQFPPEITLRIFSFLPAGRVSDLAADLDHEQEAKKSRRYDPLIVLAYRLVYLKPLVVDSTRSRGSSSEDRNNYIDIHQLALSLAGLPETLQQQAWVSTCPESVVFCFRREQIDARSFTEELNVFSDMLARLVAPSKGTAENNTHEYLAMVGTFSLVVSSGRAQSSTELPTAVGVLILRSLTHLADPRTAMSPPLLLKLRSLVIHNSDLGNFMHIGWGRLLQRFDCLELLTLNDNVIGDLVEEFEWPPHLRRLNLANNHITSANVIRKLPRSLEVLALGRNYFQQVGYDTSVFAVADFPNLCYLDLERSFALTKINPAVFVNLAKSSFATLNLYNCSLSPTCWRDLEAVAMRENFAILRGTNDLG